MVLGFGGGGRLVFDPAKLAVNRRIPSDGAGAAGGSRARLSPRGERGVWRTGPIRRPSRRLSGFWPRWGEWAAQRRTEPNTARLGRGLILQAGPSAEFLDHGLFPQLGHKDSKERNSVLSFSETFLYRILYGLNLYSNLNQRDNLF